MYSNKDLNELIETLRAQGLSIESKKDFNDYLIKFFDEGVYVTFFNEMRSKGLYDKLMSIETVDYASEAINDALKNNECAFAIMNNSLFLVNPLRKSISASYDVRMYYKLLRQLNDEEDINQVNSLGMPEKARYFMILTKLVMDVLELNSYFQESN